MGLISELRRRRVFRMAMLYVVSAWLIMQVAEVVIGLAGIPQEIGRLLLAMLAVGFPIAIALSWFLEITPEGIRVEQDAGSAATVSHPGTRRFEYVVISILAAAVILFAYDKWRAAAPPEQSIAVLPLVNVSGDPGQEYFSDGLTETLMHMLASVPEFRVAARTSSFTFKERAEDVRQVGKALGVAHVLSGSVQRAADQVRINVQLVRTDDGFNVWSESYDRDLSNIFTIQDDIAQRVSSELTRSLLGADGGTKIAGIATRNIDAYDLYLNAITEQARGSVESLQKSEKFLKSALGIDPDFHDAKVQLASNFLQQAKIGIRPPGSAFAEIAELAGAVVDARPGDTRAAALAHVARVLGANLRGEKVDFDQATDQLRGLAARSRSEVEPKLLLLGILTSMSAQQEALVLMEDLLELDPLNPQIHRDIGYAYNGLGDRDAARAALQRSLELEPAQPGAHIMLGDISRQSGNTGQAIGHWLDAMAIDPRDPDIPAGIATFLYHLGLFDEGDRFRDRAAAVAPAAPATRNAELVRAGRRGGNPDELEVARTMIADDVDLHAHAWENATRTYFAAMTRRRMAAEAIDFAGKQISGFSQFGSHTAFKLGIAQFQSLVAYQQVESGIELAARMSSLEYFLGEVMFDRGGPVWRMQEQALLGNKIAAIDIALTEIFMKPAIVYPDLDRVFELPMLDLVGTDERIASALRSWHAQMADASADAVALLARAELRP